MALTAAAAAAAASGIWSYNRENFMYDRDMRQKQEFTVLNMRLAQADLWREDVRDLIGLTEKRMDSYLVVNALELGFTITLFTEGRLEPGTPEWLLWLYMLSLVGSFLFLMMSVWFALHASVAAQGSCVRLMTQLVRPAIPSWEQIEAMRTYAYAFEGQKPSQALRVPLLQTISEGSQAGVGGQSGKLDGAPGSAAADPWGLERRGDDIYELQRRALPANRHLRLVREAMKHSQAYDAFARVSMTLGTILLCYALIYFMIGYALVQDGSPWAAWSAVLVLLGIASMLLQLDLAVSWCEHRVAQVFLLGGPVLTCVAAAEWATYQKFLQVAALTILPGTYLMHAAFLVMFSRLCHVKKQVGGAMIPTSFRSILYLDVFGWLVTGKEDCAGVKTSGEYSPLHLEDDMSEVQSDDQDDSSATSSTTTSTSPVKKAGVHQSSKRLSVVHGQNFPRHFHRKPIALRPEDVDKATLSENDPHGSMHAQREASRHLAAELAQFAKQGGGLQLPGVGPVGVIPEASEETFMAESFSPKVRDRSIPERALKSGRELTPPGQLPWLIFKAAIAVVTLVWLVGGAWVVGQALGVPDIPDQVLPESVEISGATESDSAEAGVEGWATTSRVDALGKVLSAGQRILTEWPHERFQPWGLSTDSTGRHFVISDEFQLYSATLQEVANNAPIPLGSRSLQEFATESGKSSGVVLKLGPFHTAPRCEALEGQTMRDVGVVCETPLGPDPSCKALVLHERGTRLAECALKDTQAAEAAEHVWSISSNWLRTAAEGSQREEVVSMAIESACNQSKGWSVDPSGRALALPDNTGDWCTIAGTTHGRMVRLRRHFRKESQLVPAGALWNVRGAIAQANPDQIMATSLLLTLPGGYLLKLRDDRRSVHAIDMASGKILGEWRLPEQKDRTWSALAGGAGHLYLTSQSASGDHAELWRFPVPPELRA